MLCPKLGSRPSGMDGITGEMAKATWKVIPQYM